MDTLGPRRYSRSILRSYLAELRRIGLFNELRAAASKPLVPLLKAVLEPITQLSLSILGASPGSLFSRAQAMASVVSQGIEMKWTPTGNGSGTMVLRCDDPVKELSWAAWEGVCLYICELAGTVGAASAARAAPDGRSCEINVSWEQKRK